MDVFKHARECISPAVIKSLLPDELGRVDHNQEYWIRNPLRHDESIGSFSINLKSGLYKELAAGHEESGDFIDLLSRAEKISKLDAAKKIIAASGGVIPTSDDFQKKKKNNEKFQPECPISGIKEKIKKLKWYQSQDWSIQRNGPAIKTWGWRDRNNNVLWVVTRHQKKEKNGKLKKQDIPYFFGQDGKWHQGYPMDAYRPLYGWHNYNGQKKILIVEGQTCCEPVEGWLVLTWPGGVNGVSKADFSIDIPCDRIVVWPDNDLPGQQAGRKVCDILASHSPELLKIPESKPPKWDKADAEKDGINICQFIDACEREEGVQIKREFREEIDAEKAPFMFLGYTDKMHWFIPFEAPIPYGITRGSNAIGNLLELARESWWYSLFPGRDTVSSKDAYDWLISESQKKGYFDMDKLRGAGVWREKNNEIIINTGREIITQDGRKYSYREYNSDSNYILSQKTFGELGGERATTDEGHMLIDLFRAQEFTCTLDALCCLGWALIAPFSTYFKWRPHVWLTGPKEIGKSYLLDEIITPLCGPIAHIGSGKDSEAGIKRAGIDGGCFILDEMEPRTRADRENIEKILGLIRNASSDSSSKISNAGNGKELVAYTIRQSFMLSSIVPYFGGGNAIKSRFFTCCLKSNIDFEKKKENTLKILSQKILRDPGRFRRRTFSMLKVIEENMLKIKDIVFSCRGSQRDADNIAPLLAAVFSVANDGLITEKYIDNLKRWMLQYTKEVEHDEDALLSDIFESMIKYDNNNITIGQLVYDVMHDGVDAKGYSRCLGMYGIRVCDIQHDGQTKKVVAFAPNNKNLRDILKDTFFGAGYADVLKRYQFALAETVKMRIDGKSVRAIVIDANDIDASYYGKD